MAIIGLFTDIGVLKCRQAQDNEGFKIYPTAFGVSDTKTVPFNASIAAPNSGQWYQNLISTRIVVSDNTIKFVCTVPPGVLPPSTTRPIREIYLYGVDSLGANFLIAVGQPTSDIIYDTTASVTLELQLSLTNADLTSIIVFEFTQATEIGEHNTDPNAHPDIVRELNRAGMFIDNGNTAFTYNGQIYDKKAIFDGNFASATYSGITFTANYTGTDYNSKVLTFDGIKTVGQVVLAFNAANPNTPINHNSLTGSEILPAGTATLMGGTINVSQNNLVYMDTDGKYKRALADGTIKSKVIGLADVAARVVHSTGFFAITTGFAAGTDLYLSDTIPGAFKSTPTGIKVGMVIAPNMILMSAIGGTSGLLVQGFDAVVTNESGFKFYPTTQQAINAVSDGGYILVDKLDTLAYDLITSNKNLHFVFNGPNTGWIRSAGLQERQKINFSAVPTSGTWRIEWNAQESTDLPYNATALDVQNAFNLFTGHAGVTVTGDYSVGFTLQFNDYSALPLPTFLGAGYNEIQRFNYSAVPNNGTIQFQFGGENTAHIAWNDDNAQVKTYLEALSTINEISVTGGFSSSYHQIEFVNADGMSPKANITVVDNSLSSGGSPVNYVHQVVQDGRYPASNLKAGATSISITVQELIVGTPIGPTTAIQLTADRCTFHGLGKIQNFPAGIDFNGHTGTRVEMLFDNVSQPVMAAGMVPGIDYNTSGSIGFQDDIFSQLKIIEHPTNKKRVIVSAADFLLANGGKITQELNKFLMKFDGAQIDFETGNVYESDGVTSLGINFTPATIAAGSYRWYAITLIPKSVTSDNRMKAQIFVTAASADGASADLAPRAVFVSGKKLGQVAVQGAASGIENVVQSNIDQLGIGSGSGDGGGAPFIPWLLDTPTTAFEFLSGTFSWTSDIGVINPFFGRYSIPVGSKAIVDGDILYTKLSSKIGTVGDGTVGGTIQVIDASGFSDNDPVVVGDANSNQVVGYINGAPSGNTLSIDDGTGTPIDLSAFTVAQGSWVIKSGATLYSSQPNVGDLRPDSLGNYDQSIVILGSCVGNSVFLINGVEVTKSWVYEERLLTDADLSFGDVVTLPVDSRNSSALKNYRTGYADLEVFLNGVKLSTNRVQLTGTFTPDSYNSGTGELTVPDSVDLSRVKRGSIFRDAAGVEFPVFGVISNITGDKRVGLDTGLTVDLGIGAYIFSQDYAEDGITGSYQNTITVRTFIPAGQEFEFRITPLTNKSGSGGAGGGGASTLQEAYDNGNTVTTTTGRPVQFNGPIGEKIAEFNGDITVTGVIDPKAITFTREASCPIPAGQDGIWFDAGGVAKMRNSDTETDTNVVADAPKSYVNATGASLLKGRAIRKFTDRNVGYASNTSQAAASVVGIVLDDAADGENVQVKKHGVVPASAFNTSSFVEGSLPAEGSWIWLGTNGQLTITAPAEGSGLWSMFIGFWDEGELDMNITPWGVA